MRKSRSDLQTIEKTNKIQPEFLHEVRTSQIHRHSEMTQDDAHEQNHVIPSLDAAPILTFPEQNADGDDQREGQHGMAMPLFEEQGVTTIIPFCTNCQ